MYQLRGTLQAIEACVRRGEPLSLYLEGTLLRAGLSPEGIVDALKTKKETVNDILWGIANRCSPTDCLTPHYREEETFLAKEDRENIMFECEKCHGAFMKYDYEKKQFECEECGYKHEVKPVTRYCCRCLNVYTEYTWFDPSGCPHCHRTFVD